MIGDGSGGTGAVAGARATPKTEKTDEAGGGGGLSGFALVFHAMAVMYLTTEAILNNKIDEVEDKLKQVEALRKLQQEGRLQTDTLDQNQDPEFAEAQILEGGIANDKANWGTQTDTSPCQYLEVDNNTRVLWKYDATGKITDAEVWTKDPSSGNWVKNDDATTKLNAGNTIQAEDGSLISFNKSTGTVDITRGDQHFNATGPDTATDTATAAGAPTKPVTPQHTTTLDGEAFAAENQNSAAENPANETHKMKPNAPVKFSTQDELYKMEAFLAFKEKNPGMTDQQAFNAFARAPVEEGGLGLGTGYLPGTDLTQDLGWRTMVFGDGGNNKGTLSDQIDSLMSMNQLDMLELQKLINQLNFIVTAWTNILKTYFDGLQAVARNM